MLTFVVVQGRFPLDNMIVIILSVSNPQTASEELVTPRTEEISASRREELTKLFLAQAPTALSLVQNVLDSSLEKAQQVFIEIRQFL